MASLGPGDVVAGKYRVERVLGEGGMGIVLGAMHVTLGERVALKVLRPEALTDAEARTRFLREARAAAKMKGDHVARVLDVESPEEGTPFIAMEYLEGADLAHLVETQGVLPVHLAVDYVLQACEALAEAHALGIVHRDVKPSNLFLTRAVDGAPLVKVLDFGISKATQGIDVDITATQSVLGSPAYMAPEQMRSARRVDGRTDIWAVGTILHELLTAHPPFEATTMPELCAMILQDPAPPLRTHRRDVSDGLEAVVAKCLAKSPDDRYASVQELADALAPYGGPGAREAAARIGRVGRPIAPLASDPRISIGSTPTLATARTADISGGVSAAPPTRRAFASAFAIAAVAGLAVAAGVGLLVSRQRAEAVPTTAPPSTSTLAPSAPAESAKLPSAPPTATVEASATPSASSSSRPTPGAKPTVRPATSARPTASTIPTPPPAPTPQTTASSRYD